jgi:capsular polysaccharide transport system permease protein
LISFVLLVLLPIGGTAWYLWTRAVDQYASTVGFSVRREEASSPVDLLGGLAGISSSSSSDTDILYEFLKSQKLVADLDARLDLRAIWSAPEGDPVFTFHPEGSIEDLVDYWGRMVRTSYDSSTGLIEIRVLAFTPEKATTIAQAIFDESAKMINALSDIAREDAIRFAREDLREAEEKLSNARAALTQFRVENRLVDPASAIQTQAGILGTLEGQLTEALIEVELLSESTQASDPRLRQANRRVEVIRERIATERNKVGIGGEGEAGEAYAALVADYERLTVEREFTETAYVASQAAYDTAKAEARRTSRYLAAHILPTSAEVSRYPERGLLLAAVALFLSLAWAIGSLVVYSLRDRR